ncbi:MAG: hypothetical protein PF489_00750 [Salinivirgaceae bacterium]|jgi:hypothetical protein|nr:hypothetical protein [Salinivirgaceae bacterium]
MSFADQYIQTQHFLGQPVRVTQKPDIIVAIPAFNESGIFTTLNSLRGAISVEKVLVIVVINYSVRATALSKNYNEFVYRILVDYAQKFDNQVFQVVPLIFRDMPRKHAGAGMARKVAMDSALEVYNAVDDPNGIITSLDADCLVDQYYYSSIIDRFKQHPDTHSLTLHFYHNRNGISSELNKAISEYELYLRYYVLALRYVGFPYAFHVIGSCFAVKAGAYVKHGGMNKKHAAEDFYFLHKIFPHTKNITNYNTCVSPSSRISTRVPFGTGPAVKSIVDKGEPYVVYAFEIFHELKRLFDNLETLYTQNAALESLAGKALQAFFDEYDYRSKLDDALQNSSSLAMFVKRFMQHFNAFQIVKFLNFSHEKEFYKKGEVRTEFRNYLLAVNEQAESNDLNELLDLALKLEKKILSI